MPARGDLLGSQRAARPENPGAPLGTLELVVPAAGGARTLLYTRVRPARACVGRAARKPCSRRVAGRRALFRDWPSHRQLPGPRRLPCATPAPLRPSVQSRAQLPRGQAAPPCPQFLRAAGPKRPWEGDEWHEQAPALPLAEISGSRLPTPLPKRLREGARLHPRRRRGEIAGLSYQSASALATSRDFGKRRTQGRDPGSPPEAHPNGHNPPAPHRLGPPSSMHGRRARAVGRLGKTNSLSWTRRRPLRQERPEAARSSCSLARSRGWLGPLTLRDQDCSDTLPSSLKGSHLNLS